MIIRIVSTFLFCILLSSAGMGQKKERMVAIDTEFGTMVIKLYNDTPIHRDNFIKLAKEGFFDGTLFHRSLPYFMAQGGDPFSKNAGPNQGLGVDNCAEIPAEILPHHYHKKGALAAARLPDSSNPTRKSSACQFFVVAGYKHNDQQLDALENENRKFTPFQRAWYKVRGGYPFLDGDYTVFGEIVEGFDIIDLITQIPTSQEGATKDRPLQDVKMTVRVLN